MRFTMPVRHALRRVHNSWRLLLARAWEMPIVAHHGMQRSGTNFLMWALTESGVPVANAIEPHRCQPRHKHFRWQHDKSTIPSFIAAEYGNQVRVASLEGVNESAGYPAACRHLVIRKSETAWLKSIMNWGLMCSWFGSREEALTHVMPLVRDYQAYYGFWHGIAEASPQMVRIIEYDELARDPGCVRDVLEEVGVRPSRLVARGVSELPMSPADRREHVSAEDVHEARRRMGWRPAVEG